MSSGVPVWVKPEKLELDDRELFEAMNSSAVGFWLDEHIFAEAIH